MDRQIWRVDSQPMKWIFLERKKHKFSTTLSGRHGESAEFSNVTALDTTRSINTHSSLPSLFRLYLLSFPSFIYLNYFISNTGELSIVFFCFFRYLFLSDIWFFLSSRHILPPIFTDLQLRICSPSITNQLPSHFLGASLELATLTTVLWFESLISKQ